MSSKICNKCGMTLTFDNYYNFTTKTLKKTYTYSSKTCKSCIALYHSLYREKNKQQLLDKKKVYYKHNKDRILSNVKARYYSDKQEEILEKNKIYRKEYRKRVKTKALRAEYQARRYRVQLRQTPAWANLSKIKAIYENCQLLSLITGNQFHVDHIIPLKGKNVSGLHVESNLRIILAIDNLKKSNKT